MFKKAFLLYLFLSINQLSISQTYEDVLRYNSFNHEGTSRFNSMGGAFGALGGDLSAISINPASSSVFLDSEIGITLKYKNQKITNNLNNSNSNSKNDLFSYGGSGVVLVYENRKSKFTGFRDHRLDAIKCRARHLVSDQQQIPLLIAAVYRQL